MILEKVKVESEEPIHYTKDYAEFTYLRGNRSVTQKHVKELVADIKRTGIIAPMIVDQRGNVLDGQHRLEAARLLSMSIGFVIIHTENIEASLRIVSDLNRDQNMWTQEDFLKAFVNMGKDDYAWMSQLHISNHFPVSFLVSVSVDPDLGLSGREIFRNGDMIVPEDRRRSVEFLLSQIDEIRYLDESWGKIRESARFLAGLANCIVHPKYHSGRMINAVESDLGFVKKGFSARSYTYQFQIAYNRRQKGSDHLNFMELKKEDFSVFGELPKNIENKEVNGE